MNPTSMHASPTHRDVSAEHTHILLAQLRSVKDLLMMTEGLDPNSPNARLRPLVSPTSYLSIHKRTGSSNYLRHRKCGVVLRFVQTIIASEVRRRI